MLAGPNGAGKTNLLEAIGWLGPGRSLRGAKTGEVRAWAPDGTPGVRAWGIGATVAGPHGTVELATGLTPEGGERRAAQVDGQPLRTPALLGRHLWLLWLTPAQDGLFRDEPGARRRFLDRLAAALDPHHAERVAAYEHHLRERARLLQAKGAAPGNPADRAWLQTLEAQMAATGIALAASRQDAARRLSAASLLVESAFPQVRLTVEGAVETALTQGSASAAEQCLRDQLAAARARDGAQGGAAAGPHRSDLIAQDAATGLAAAAASTGQQKTLLIAIVLAAARMIAAERGAPPLLLLDDVVAHLDPGRRAALFAALWAVGAQSWMTGTDLADFAHLGAEALYYAVEPGAIALVSSPGRKA